ncbi:MAG: L-carnitine dehydratase/bile acid-inducible protein [Sphingomonadales bacterium]|nr:L-carnitine dehydratase/bile acid-inducible protein [Sphingomonadales bacterium]
MSGPLIGLRIVEFAGLGPTPFACMMLADMGAEVLRIERLGADNFGGGDERHNYLNRSRASIALDLKSPTGVTLARDLIDRADVVIEGFRPGVMERLGLGPEPVMKANERLIYARMTGWGQDGPQANKAGHDINYLSMTGALYLMGPFDGPPMPPINLVANYGGGGMLMVTGVLAALVERGISGRGQLVDATMIDGASQMITQIYSWEQMGRWRPGRGGNVLDGSAYFYRCYECSDGKFVAVGALEPQFHDNFLMGLGIDPTGYGDHLDPTSWAERATAIAAIMLTRSRAEWAEVYKAVDACLTPVLSPEEAVTDPANIARHVHVEIDGAVQPAPAPRFGRTRSEISSGPPLPGERGADRLRDWGMDAGLIDRLVGENKLRAA